jgi:hypothetical protein
VLQHIFKEEQIDDLWDYVERRWSASRRVEIKNSESLTDHEELAKRTYRELMVYLEGLDLYGRVLKNLEFADKKDKISHLNVFLMDWARVTLFFMNV